MALPLTKEQIQLAIAEQKRIIATCNSAIVDANFNINVLQNKKNDYQEQKQVAKAIINDLQEDFPTASGITTAAGAAAGTSLISSALISEAITPGMTVVIWPDNLTKRDKKQVMTFDTIKGEISIDPETIFKGGKVASGVPFKVMPAVPTD